MNGVLNQGNNQWESSFIRWSWVLSKLNMNLSFQKRNLTYCHHVPTIFFPFTSQTFKSRACGFTFYINNYLYESKFSTRNLHQMLCSSHIKIWNLAKYLKKQNKNIKIILHCNYIQCHFYTFYGCPTTFHCSNPTVLFKFNYCSKYSGKMQCRFIGEKLKKIRVWCSLFIFFMWFARFQILIFEPQSIWREFGQSLL